MSSLWRIHAVHNSIEELNSFNSYHHVSEYLMRIPLLALPINLLLFIDMPQIVAVSVLFGAVGSLSHSNSRVSYGPLR